MLNIYGETLSEVEIDTLYETLVERQARIQVGSLENKNIGAARHIGCWSIISVG